MTRVDVYYRKGANDVVPKFDQFSVHNELSVRAENGIFRIDAFNKGIILLPIDLVRRIDLVDCD